ncbi:MAG TPA: tripartite tricarboxylate transporter substrate binding protein [Casimicrobiaceae bacterium]|jgi:tripartite-type tricarboxylate transporter receptor subunit TctC|nr:tripartite tricarboxylate transporter substrate binding protein [Casimicrobiaceae bacterium]
MKCIARLAAIALFALTAVAARGDTFPSRPIRIVVPFAAGGATDLIARVVGQKLTESLGQAVVVENRPGASGMIGADLVAKAPPDGYTLLMASTAEIAINPSLYSKMSYDPQKDLAPITLAGVTPLILVVNPASPLHSVADIVKEAKAHPGTISFASAGNGSVQHLSGELVKVLTSTDMVHVPYKGAAPALTDVLSGQVTMFFSGMPPAMPHVKSGKLRALAVTTPKRSPAAPDVPTMAEAGVQGFDISNWFGLLAPAGTPPGILDKLHDEAVKALMQPTVKERLAEQGAEVVADSREHFGAFIKAEADKYAKLIKVSGAKAD